MIPGKDYSYFITKLLAEVSGLQVSHVIVWQYQKQHILSWPGVPSSSCGTGSGSCQDVYPAENEGDHEM